MNFKNQIAHLLTQRSEQPEIPQNNWDKLPPEIRHQILDHFKYIHEPTKVMLSHLSQSHISLRKVTRFIEKYKGEFDTTVFNIMRVNHQWYCDVTRLYQYKSRSLVNFYDNWATWKALEVLLTRPVNERKGRKTNWLRALAAEEFVAEKMEETCVESDVEVEDVAAGVVPMDRG